MKNQDREEQRITSEDAWESIHATLDRSRSLMYVAGWPSILLLWGAIVSVGYLTQFVVEMAFPTFADDYPWFPGPLWGVLGTIGMIGSSIFGRTEPGMRTPMGLLPPAPGSKCSFSG